MARAQKKKARSHVAAAHSQAAKKKQGAVGAPASALGAAAVAATFGLDNENDDDAETQPIDNEQSGDEEDGENAALSRGQRKRMKRRAAFMKKMGLVQRVTQEKAKEVKKAEQGVFADLEELQASLFMSDKDAAKAKKTAVTTATATAASVQKKKMSGKQRQKLAVRELVHLKAVHSHSSFQGNPFAAIQMHLQNTVVQANQENIEKTNAAAAKKSRANANRMDTEA
ncbi:Cystathionine gamma-synthase, partial [Globisporangium splendens]